MESKKNKNREYIALHYFVWGMRALVQILVLYILSSEIFWKRHSHEHNNGNKNVLTKAAEFFSTHPLSMKRSKEIESRAQEMDALSEDCGCSSLKKEMLQGFKRKAVASNLRT